MAKTFSFVLRPKPVEEYSSLLLLNRSHLQHVTGTFCAHSFSLATELWITWFVVGRGSEGGS